MNRTILTLVLAGIIAMTAGCQSDSNYLLGTYDVVTTVQTSNCASEEFQNSGEQYLLPTGFIPDQLHTSYWQLERVGITGTGANNVEVTIAPTALLEHGLTLSGTLDDGVLRIEEQHDVLDAQHRFRRFIVVYGLVDEEYFTGEIRTVLSNAQPTSHSSDGSSSAISCEVYEEFRGRPATATLP